MRSRPRAEYARSRFRRHRHLLDRARRDLPPSRRLWFFTGKARLFESGTNPRPGLVQQFDGSIVDRMIGINAAWIVLGVLELVVFAAVVVSVVAGEFLPTRPKPWLLGALAGAMLTLGVLLCGTTLNGDSTTAAQHCA